MTKELKAKNTKGLFMKRYNDLIKQNPLMVGIKFARYKFVSKLLNSDDNILELGCYDGVSSNFYSKYSKSIVGIDIDKQAIEEASSFFPDIHFRCENVFDFSSDTQYDAIVLLDFIEHFTKADGEKIISKYSKMLTSSGLMIIGTPSKNFEQYRAEHNRKHHLHEYYPDEIANLVKKYFYRTMVFSMNDEIVYAGNENLAWFIFVVGISNRKETND